MAESGHAALCAFPEQLDERLQARREEMVKDHVIGSAPHLDTLSVEAAALRAAIDTATSELATITNPLQGVDDEVAADQAVALVTQYQAETGPPVGDLQTWKEAAQFSVIDSAIVGKSPAEAISAALATGASRASVDLLKSSSSIKV